MKCYAKMLRRKQNAPKMQSISMTKFLHLFINVYYMSNLITKLCGPLQHNTNSSIHLACSYVSHNFRFFLLFFFRIIEHTKM